jgi:AcrR family transcriptional regulator
MSHERRAELLPVIARAFVELGFRKATTAELARRCRVRENILFRLWTDKKAMFIASIEHVYSLSESIWMKVLAADPSCRNPAELLLRYESVHQGEFGNYRIIFAGLNEIEDPDIRVSLRNMFLRFHSFISNLVRETFVNQAGDPSRNPEMLAWALIGLGTVTNITRDLDVATPDERQQLMLHVGGMLLELQGESRIHDSRRRKP